MVHEESLLIITGSYGSGKTEYAINLAVSKNRAGRPVTLVDLDVVNPYFRSRDVRDLFLRMSIEVIAPEGAFSHADLPMLSPKIKGAIKRTDRTIICDAGGDPMGARVLGRFSDVAATRGYKMIFVVNTRRPETQTLEGVLVMAANIEKASGLKITELIANSHLMDQTDISVIIEGVEITRQAAQKMGVEFSKACVLDDIIKNLDTAKIDAELVILKKFMTKPWEPGGHKAFRC